MPAPSRSARKLADTLVIFASVASLGNAMWGPTIFRSMLTSAPAGDRGVGYNWIAFGLAGILGLLAIFLTMKWPSIARLPLVAGGLMLLVVPFVYERTQLLPIVTSVILGLAMLAAAPFFGPMPAPSAFTRGRDQAAR
jgi:hypothetical protein